MKSKWLILAALSAGLCACNSMNSDKSTEHKSKSMSHKEEEENEGDEVKMSLDQVPAPVRATLMREAGDAKIKTVDKESKDGKTIYETDVMKAGTNWEIRVAENGDVISKKVDNEEAEKGEKKSGKKAEKEEEDDEKNEKK